MIKKFIKRLLSIQWHMFKRLLRPVFYTALGGLIAALTFGVIYLNNRPELSLWHEVILEGEFSTSSKVDSIDAYLKLEDQLFQELELQIYDKVPQAERTTINRYSKGSKTDPNGWPKNWNRTFELATDTPTAGVLLLHGLSDSPYSLRTMGNQFHGAGAHVVGLRIPGHGTAPSGLRVTTFEDMAAAVEMAMRDIKATVGDAPIYIVGYSNGGALAVHYTNKAITDSSLLLPAGLILLSPEIGISSAAAFASVQKWMGEVLRLRKLSWNSIEIEYDPYKYNSFALNAGILAYNGTQLIRAQLESLQKNGQIDKMPPILAFQSAADATVKAPVLISELFDKLQAGQHELVIFDVNRVFETDGLLKPPLDVQSLISGQSRLYKVSLLTNKSPTSPSAVLQERAAGSEDVETQDLGINWPSDVYSLAHIALPFPPDDPIYGSGDNGLDQKQTLTFGDLVLHGERKTLAIPETALTRQHWNPFYSVITTKVHAFANLDGASSQ